MSDRPLTLVLIAVAILIALYLRRSRGPITSAPEMLSPAQMRREGEVRGIKVDFSQPLTREQFNRILGPVSAK